MRQEVLRLEHVTRMVGGAARLDDFSLHLFQGEIFGLMPMNDLGKKELVELLRCNVPIHYGFVYLQEKLVNSYRKSDGSANKVSVIGRRSGLADSLSVAENVFILRQGCRKYLINARVLRQQLWSFLEEAELEVSPDALAVNLSSYERCAVELVKAVVSGTKLVVISDLSNVLSTVELARFHELMRHYALQGFTFLYLCAHHEEAMVFCDRIAIMQKGHIVLQLEAPFESDEAIWRRSLDFSQKAEEHCQEGRPLLEFRNIRTGTMDRLSFALWPGECVAILDKNNTILEELVRLMRRSLTPQDGSIFMNGRPFGLKRLPGQAVGFVGADPVRTAIFPQMSAVDNLCMATSARMPQLWLRRAVRKSIEREYYPIFGEAIHAPDASGLPVRTQYDLAYYRQHLYHPELTVCVQPFLGADMYLRHHVISLLEVLRGRGITTLLLLVNISDSLSVADRLLVVEDGTVARQYGRKDYHKLSKQEGYDTHRT